MKKVPVTIWQISFNFLCFEGNWYIWQTMTIKFQWIQVKGISDLKHPPVVWAVNKNLPIASRSLCLSVSSVVFIFFALNFKMCGNNQTRRGVKREYEDSCITESEGYSDFRS